MEETVFEVLKASGHKFDRAIDNVRKYNQLIWHCREFM